MPTKAQQSDIDAAQAAIEANLRRLRLGPLSHHTPKTHLTLLLISLFEWCAHHNIDFDATVLELHEQYAMCSAFAGLCTEAAHPAPGTPI